MNFILIWIFFGIMGIIIIPFTFFILNCTLDNFKSIEFEMSILKDCLKIKSIFEILPATILLGPFSIIMFIFSIFICFIFVIFNIWILFINKLFGEL